MNMRKRSSRNDIRIADSDAPNGKPRDVGSEPIKTWPTKERPRERLLAEGPERQTDADLLAIILRVGSGTFREGVPGKNAYESALAILRDFRGLRGLDRARINELLKAPGLGPAKVAQIKAALELGKRVVAGKLTAPAFESSKAVADHFRPRFTGRRQEIVIAVFLNGQNRRLGEKEITEGTPTQLVPGTPGEAVSGGFLIRAFEHVRNKISDDVQAKKDVFREATEAKRLKEDDELSQIEDAFIRFNRELDPEQADPPSRVRKLAYDCIFGTDAEPRAARTAKMNMIMHGDGHGGIHYHDGLVDINGVFGDRFNVVLTNPPFGQNVGEDQKFGGSEETRVPNDVGYCKRSLERYGEDWQVSHNRTLKLASLKTTILDSFEIGKNKPNRPTEILFLERCIQLLTPGGRMGIVLPDGNLNNPSLSWLRRWAEGKARLIAVVSLPEETFRSAEATVKASLVFLRRFTEADEVAWEDAWPRLRGPWSRHTRATSSSPRSTPETVQ
jgi:DNA repair protein RadC